MGLIPINERTIEPTASELFPVESTAGTRKVAQPLNEIVDNIQIEARQAGFEPPLFTVFSGYRSIASQQRLFDRKKASLRAENPEMSEAEIIRIARKTVAPPGRSSHHTGFAVDINLGSKRGFSIDSAKAENVRFIESTPQYAFMKRMGEKYNLTQLPNEPWHWECDRGCRDSFEELQQSISKDEAFGETRSAFSIKSTGGKLLIGALFGVSVYFGYKLLSED